MEQTVACPLFSHGRSDASKDGHLVNDDQILCGVV